MNEGRNHGPAVRLGSVIGLAWPFRGGLSGPLDGVDNERFQQDRARPEHVVLRLQSGKGLNAASVHFPDFYFRHPPNPPLHGYEHVVQAAHVDHAVQRDQE